MGRRRHTRPTRAVRIGNTERQKVNYPGHGTVTLRSAWYQRGTMAQPSDGLSAA